MNTENEIWVDVPEFVGLYQMTSTGRFRSVPQHNGKCGRKMGQEIKTRIGRAGYVFVALRKSGHRQNNYLVHRLLAAVFIPNPENKPCINHINSQRDDNRIENLEWCTYSENNAHAHRVGGQRAYYGESHSQSKLTAAQAEEIRAKFKPRIYTYPMLSKEYGISIGALQAIISNKTWVPCL